MKIKKIILFIPIIVVLVIVSLYILGATVMNKPLISEKEIVLDYNVRKIWNIVVNNEDYSWRSGIKTLEVIEDGRWKEFYDENNFTVFTLRDKIEYTLYSFDMENRNFWGTWTGKFVEINESQTRLIFTETISMKNKIMNVLARLFWNLEAMQEQYFNDLAKKLNE